MSRGVNLIPAVCRRRRARAGRLRLWTLVCGGAALLVGCAWILVGQDARETARLQAALSAAQAGGTELERELTLAARQRDVLVEKARALLQVRDGGRLASRFAQLHQGAPAGVMLTEVVARPAPPAPPAAAPAAAAVKPGAPAAALPPAARPRLLDTDPIVQIAGLAASQADVSALMDALRGVEGWNRIELLRASAQPAAAGELVAFKLECRRAEGTP